MKDSKFKKFIKKAWKPVLLILVFALSFYLLLKDCNFNELGENIKSMKMSFLILAISMVFAQIFIQGLCYVVMGRKLDTKINPIAGFGYCSIDLFFSQITPFAVGGQPVMIYEMNKNKVPVSKSTTMVLLYSFLNKLALIIMAIISVIVYNSKLVRGDWIFVALLAFGVVCNLIIGGFSILCMFMGGLVYKLGVRLLLFLHKRHLVKDPYAKIRKLRKTISDFKEGNKYIKDHLFISFIVLLLCILKRIATFSIGYFIYKGLGCSGYSFLYIIAIQTIIALVADSFPIPGGIGAYEETFNSLYSSIYPGSLVTAALLLVRGISYYLLIVVSGAGAIVTTLAIKKKGGDLDENMGIHKEEL